jgi:hypothetical protein
MREGRMLKLLGGLIDDRSLRALERRRRTRGKGERRLPNPRKSSQDRRVFEFSSFEDNSFKPVH